MNRRKFFQRISAAAVIPVAVPVLARLEAHAPSPDRTPPAIDGQTVTVVTPEGKELEVTVGEGIRVVPDLLTLLLARGLMRPCPNCHAVLWGWPHNRCCMECAGCGWRDTPEHFSLPCPCDDCAPYRRMSQAELMTATRRLELRPANLAYLERDAPAGWVYRVVDAHGQQVTRFTRNAYDINTDGYLHNVTERRIARVSCAIRVTRDHPKTYGVGLERSYQPNGNLVIHGWEMVDCYEQQQAREQWRGATAPTGQPKVEDYGSYEAFVHAMSDWRDQQATRAIRFGAKP
jgi:hypothetical protein